VDIIRLTEELGEQFASRAEQMDQSFTMSVPEGRVHVSGSENQLRQVVINLLENALKFTPANGKISLTVEQSTDAITVTVSDSGIGIPPEDLPHVFERFHRGRNASEYSGNGLGLAIVKAIVSEHYGQVAIQSPAGQGTKVSIVLPTVQD
jgi:signal transduction histidine kinase